MADLLGGVGKLLGVVGGVVAGLVQIYEGWRAYDEGDVTFGIGTALLGLGTIVVAGLIFFTAMTAGAGCVLVLILIAIGYVVSLFKHDKLQHWLDSCYYGAHKLGGEKYHSFGEQRAAYMAMVKGG